MPTADSALIKALSETAYPLAGSARDYDPLVDRIGARDPGVDTVAMDNANETRLDGIQQIVATPTVYDLDTHEVVDTTGNNWLKRLVGHR